MGRSHGGCGQLLSLTAAAATRRVFARFAAGILALAALAGASAANAEAEAPRDRLLGAVAQHALLPADLGAEIERRCQPADTRCAARLIAGSLPAARLIRVNHPDTDTIRRAHTEPSVTAVERQDDATLVVVLDRFGRTADREVADAVGARADGARVRLVLDLRNNGGGDFDRMRRVASLFTGPREGAIRLVGLDGAIDVALPAPLRVLDLGGAAIDVLIGPGTASSAEVLAALLRRHAGARLVGARTVGKNWLTRVVPVDHDWRLAIPAERIEVPGEALAQGLLPDIETASPAGP